MELRVNLTYTQILSLIEQLPQQEISRLRKILLSEKKKIRKSSSLKQLILDAPTWTSKNVKAYKEVREQINKSRLA
ncbi:MAG: hypothetical protein IPM74_05405 [Crocinitomicaceae bacterium]|nr:hypothetical protein [Crocinitomicaceae bacterium]